MERRIDLSNYSILDNYGVERRALEGFFTAETLSQMLVYEWIPYYECDKCGRSDYCKFTKPNPYNPERKRDIKCGVAAAALTNFIAGTFHLLENMKRNQIQDYLDAVFYFYDFIYSAEQIIGMYIDKDMIEWWDVHIPAAFGHATRLRDKLNSLASSLRDIPEFRATKGILFVEGWSEKAFLDKLRESHSAWFLYLIIEVYDGKGNANPKRIQMLLDRYIAQGYKIYIQGDADGKNTEIFNKLVLRGSVGSECTFVFQHDFETAVPAELLLDTLQDIGHLKDVDRKDFVQNKSERPYCHVFCVCWQQKNCG